MATEATQIPDPKRRRTTSSLVPPGTGLTAAVLVAWGERFIGDRCVLSKKVSARTSIQLNRPEVEHGACTSSEFLNAAYRVSR
jgi:hypothetical protein